MSDTSETVSADAQLMLGLHIAIVHIFNCLNGKGILPFSESIQSLRETIDSCESAPEGAKVVLEAIIKSLEIIESKCDAPDPSKPPPPTRLH